MDEKEIEKDLKVLRLYLTTQVIWIFILSAIGFLIVFTAVYLIEGVW